MSYLSQAFPASTRFAAIDGYYNGFFTLDGQLGDDLREFVTTGLDGDSLFVISDEGLASLPAPFDGVRLIECSPFQSIGRPLQVCATEPSDDLTIGG